MTNKVSFPVFNDKKGNRFIFPGLNSHHVSSASERWSRGRVICASIGVTEEADTFDVAYDESYSFVRADAGSSGFLHGHSEVHMISGPIFDEINQPQNNS